MKSTTRTPVTIQMTMMTTEPVGYERFEGVWSYTILPHPDNPYRLVIVIWFAGGAQCRRELMIRQPLLVSPSATATRGVCS